MFEILVKVFVIIKMMILNGVGLNFEKWRCGLLLWILISVFLKCLDVRYL